MSVIYRGLISHERQKYHSVQKEKDYVHFTVELSTAKPFLKSASTLNIHFGGVFLEVLSIYSMSFNICHLMKAFILSAS